PGGPGWRGPDGRGPYGRGPYGRGAYGRGAYGRGPLGRGPLGRGPSGRRSGGPSPGPRGPGGRGVKPPGPSRRRSHGRSSLRPRRSPAGRGPRYGAPDRLPPCDGESPAPPSRGRGPRSWGGPSRNGRSSGRREVPRVAGPGPSGRSGAPRPGRNGGREPDRWSPGRDPDRWSPGRGPDRGRPPDGPPGFPPPRGVRSPRLPPPFRGLSFGRSATTGLDRPPPALAVACVLDGDPESGQLVPKAVRRREIAGRARGLASFQQRLDVGVKLFGTVGQDAEDRIHVAQCGERPLRIAGRERPPLDPPVELPHEVEDRGKPRGD